jgi:hypothetical protein
VLLGAPPESRSTSTNNAGTSRIANALEKIMPTIVTLPMGRRAAAPAPTAVQSGSKPKINANGVINIGRSRKRPPLSAACPNDSPFQLRARKLHDQDGVFRRQPDQHDESDLRIHVIVKPPRP